MKEDFIRKYASGYVDDFNKALDGVIFESEKEIIKKIEGIMVEEILICHQENTPTSRLTSLMMKIKRL